MRGSSKVSEEERLRSKGEEGPKFKALYFKNEGLLIQVFSCSLSNDQLQLTLRSQAPELSNSLRCQGKLTLGSDNTTVTKSNDFFGRPVEEIEITIEENTVFVVLDDETWHQCIKIKYPFDPVYGHFQILCSKSTEYMEISMETFF